ncbi:7TM diverse intracellular signaling domain-containing protein [Sulfuritalea sp.]|uniref:7TM diverse intracellular signaling domain-containing protein n=1 Tax=Sulfuritalea sp. TaxID=2480090 RepID=UPI001AD166DC|nr:7TM diverse intracellular signaling domain-containing protein [Sulfuritalea sp.]MBN8476813.1 diguanylate cyclase [Sulfuritalea sp.]
MSRLPVLLSVLFFLVCQVDTAIAALRLTSDTVSHALAAEVGVYEDAAGSMSLADAQGRGAEFRRSPRHDGESVNFGYSSSAWWLRVDLAADRGARRDWLLEVGFPTLDSVEFYGPDGERLSAGDRRPFATRPIPHRNFVFPVRLPESGTGTVWLRIVSEGTLTIPLRIWRSDAFWQQSMIGYTVLSVYFGMLLALALYNLLLWFSLRESVYFSYVLFATGMAVGQLSMNGLGNQFLWPAWPLWGNHAFAVGFAAAGLFGALFVRGFLATRRNQPRLDGAIVGLAGLFAVCMLVPLVAPYRLAAILTSLTGVSFSVVAVLAGLRGWRAEQPGARTFLLAWTVLLLGAAVFGLRNMDVVPTTFLSFYALQMGSALEMLLLSFALADRINGLRREKDAAQGEALAAKQELVAALKRSEAGLERRVGERTAELEALNARLRENERQLQALAHTDTLTGLANRLLLGARLEQSIQLARRSQGQIALLLVDVDRFKAINDTYGHAIGDEVLRVAAQRLRAAVRAVDTVARLGGDEFAVVLSGLSGAADAERMAEKIVIGVREPMRVLGMPLEISVSVGVATYSGGDLSPAELMRRADQAMYAAKSAGRDCFRVFSA